VPFPLFQQHTCTHFKIMPYYYNRNEIKKIEEETKKETATNVAAP
jgi:hypothetical protein